MKAFSIDLRSRVLAAYDAGEGTRKQIADRFSVSLGFLAKLLSQRKRTGSIEPVKPAPKRPPMLKGKPSELVAAYVEKHPDATLKQIQEHLAKNGTECSLFPIFKELKRLGYRRKKNSTRQ